MELPLLPLNFATSHLETHTLRLYDMQRLDIVTLLPLLPFLFPILRNEIRQEIMLDRWRVQPLSLG